MVFVSVTRLHIRSWRFFPAFVWNANRSIRQARSAAGNLHVAVNRDRHAAYWTLTLWADEAAMRQFMMSGPHRRIMPRLVEWCDEAALAHWLQESPDVPSWNEAHRRLVLEGRASKVKHPSEAQRKFIVPPPG